MGGPFLKISQFLSFLFSPPPLRKNHTLDCNAGGDGSWARGPASLPRRQAHHTLLLCAPQTPERKLPSGPPRPSVCPNSPRPSWISQLNTPCLCRFLVPRPTACSRRRHPNNLCSSQVPIQEMLHSQTEEEFISLHISPSDHNHAKPVWHFRRPRADAVALCPAPRQESKGR